MIQRNMADLPWFGDIIWFIPNASDLLYCPCAPGTCSTGGVRPRYHTYVIVVNTPSADLPVPRSLLE